MRIQWQDPISAILTLSSLRLAPWRTSPRQAYPGFQFGLGQQADGTAILQPELLAIEEQGKALVERQAGGSSIGLSFLEGGQPAGKIGRAHV